MKLELTILSGGITGLLTALSAKNFIDYAATKTALVQDYLSRESNITYKAIEKASEAAQKIVGPDIIPGFAYGIMAGIFLGLTIYAATSIKEKEK
ncbi:MAG: hypothetical protein QW622_01495 [Candidatus Pacearchaeota archaeon]